MARASGQMPKEGQLPTGGRAPGAELVFALCHEVGNLLLATRLQGRVPAEDTGARISELCGRAGALVALVRPLLSAPLPSPQAVDTSELLDALPRALEVEAEGRVQVAREGAEQLPAVAVDAEALLHLLLADVYAALAEPPSGGRVRVFAGRDRAGVAFGVEGPGELPSAGLSGRALTRAVGEALLCMGGGAVRVGPAGAGARVCFVAPAADPPG